MPPAFKSEFVRLKEIFLKCKVLVLEEPFFALCILKSVYRVPKFPLLSELSPL